MSETPPPPFETPAPGAVPPHTGPIPGAVPPPLHERAPEHIAPPAPMPTPWLLFTRPLAVTWRLLPFVIAIMRDFRRYVLFGSPRPVTREQLQVRASALTDQIAILGPTFIKLVQVLAMREDLIPKVYADEFKKLQDQVPPVDYELVRQTVEAEFGRPIADVFDGFERTPIAAASLGQVHRARYRGTDVAVKVQRPGVERLVATDLRVMHSLTHVAAFLFDGHFVVRNLAAVVHEFSRIITQELDFGLETQTIERFRVNLAKFDRVIVPDVFHEASGRRVITLRYYKGSRVDDAEAMRRAGLEPMAMLETMVEVYTHMVVVDGLLHADPHPGNLLVHPDGRLVILDYGMVVDLDADTKMELLKAMVAAVRGDMNGVVDGFYRLRMVEPGTNMATLRDAARVIMSINLETEYSPFMIQRIGEDILRTFYQFPLRMPSSLVYLFRTAALIEGIGMAYEPRFNGVRFSTPIVKRVVAKVYASPDRSIYDRVIDKVREFGEFYENIERVVFKLDREELRVRAHPNDLLEIERYFNTLQRRIMVAISAAALAGVTALIYIGNQNNTMLIVGEIIAFVMLTVLIVLPIRRRRPTPDDRQ